MNIFKINRNIKDRISRFFALFFILIFTTTFSAGGIFIVYAEDKPLELPAETEFSKSIDQEAAQIGAQVTTENLQTAAGTEAPTKATVQDMNNSMNSTGVYDYTQTWTQQSSINSAPVITPAGSKMNTQSGVAQSADCGISVSNDSFKYCMLAPVGGILGDLTTASKGGKTEIVNLNNLGDFFNKIYIVGITIAVGLAIIFISFGGIRMATTDSIGGVAKGREMITAAITGLLIALFSYVILYTINPALLSGTGVNSSVFSTQPTTK